MNYFKHLSLKCMILVFSVATVSVLSPTVSADEPPAFSVHSIHSGGLVMFPAGDMGDLVSFGLGGTLRGAFNLGLREPVYAVAKIQGMSLAPKPEETTLAVGIVTIGAGYSLPLDLPEWFTLDAILTYGISGYFVDGTWGARNYSGDVEWGQAGTLSLEAGFVVNPGAAIFLQPTWLFFPEIGGLKTLFGAQAGVRIPFNIY
jgi:hypothetical protein